MVGRGASGETLWPTSLRNFWIVRALAGDSTITSRFGASGLAASVESVVASAAPPLALVAMLRRKVRWPPPTSPSEREGGATHAVRRQFAAAADADADRRAVGSDRCGAVGS